MALGLANGRHFVFACGAGLDATAAKRVDSHPMMKARGGSLNATGPTVAAGMLYVNSGYGQLGGMAGNVLLAFAPEQQ